jgi:hypothetical protein
MKFYLCVFLLCVIGLRSSKAQISIELNLGNTTGQEFLGYKLDSSGFFAGGYTYKWRPFGSWRRSYKTCWISREKLDPLLLKRIELLIENNQELQKDTFYYNFITVNPIRYNFEDNRSGEKWSIWDYYVCSDKNESRDCYCISELRYLLTLLVPDRYEELRFTPWLYSQYMEE